MREVTPAFLVFVRTAGGALLAGPVRRPARRSRPRCWPAGKRWWLWLWLSWPCPGFSYSMPKRRSRSSLAGLLVAAVPIAGAIIARLTGTDRLDGRRATGLVLGVAGVAALVGFDVGGSDICRPPRSCLSSSATPSGPGSSARYLSGPPRAERDNRCARPVRHRLRSCRHHPAPPARPVGPVLRLWPASWWSAPRSPSYAFFALVARSGRCARPSSPTSTRRWPCCSA